VTVFLAIETNDIAGLTVFGKVIKATALVAYYLSMMSLDRLRMLVMVIGGVIIVKELD
jgi:hypothetical protein